MAALSFSLPHSPTHLRLLIHSVCTSYPFQPSAKAQPHQHLLAPSGDGDVI